MHLHWHHYLDCCLLCMWNEIDHKDLVIDVFVVCSVFFVFSYSRIDNCLITSFARNCNVQSHFASVRDRAREANSRAHWNRNNVSFELGKQTYTVQSTCNMREKTATITYRVCVHHFAQRFSDVILCCFEALAERCANSNGLVNILLHQIDLFSNFV